MQNYAASIQGTVVRASRLNTAGAIPSGSTNSYQLQNFVRVSFTPEYEAGDEFTDKRADGGICASYKAQDVLKYVTIELEICEPDPELSELIDGGTLLASGGTSVGYASPQVGVVANPNGNSLEVWSKAITNGRQAATLPFFKWVFPQVYLHLTGERVIENGRLATVFSGFGYGNAGYASGPTSDWTFPSDRPYQYARVASAPSTTGYITTS